MTITVTQTSEYRFDEERADRPCRFIEKYCRHWEGRWAAKPFLLLPWQRQLVRTLFGWVRVDDQTRRFRELYFESAKGSGKTPLLAAIALYCLIGDGEQGAHVISIAGAFQQANLSYECGKMFIEHDSRLSEICTVAQYVVRGPKNSKWTILSGSGKTKSGPRPSCVLADELHEWEEKTAMGFDTLTRNCVKRAQPLILMGTNSGTSLQGFCHQQHERALAVINGEMEDPQLLPYVFSAPESMKWDSEEAAAAANPSLGTFISFAQLKPEIVKAKADIFAENEYRRLQLGQWRQVAKKWLSAPQWASRCGQFLPADLPKETVCYVGIDLSHCDDLCSAVLVYATPGRFFIDSHFWLPKETAERYQAQGFPYLAWAAKKHITLLAGSVVSEEDQETIAKWVVDRAKKFPVKAVCYDPYRAGHCIAAIEAAQLPCVAIRQGFSLTPGCDELERRLKEGSIVIAPNSVLTAHADTVETAADSRGNYWPVKPLAKKNNAGKRSAKIDGIAALVTALVEARKHSWPKARITGGAWIIAG